MSTRSNTHTSHTLAEPLVDRSGTPRVLFAGEATDNTHFSTVHGATDTGFREAKASKSDTINPRQYPHAPVHTYTSHTLAEPLVDRSGTPRVLFAGEATDNTHFSTVHGATDTGFREASRLLPQAKL
ncbi:hypothetical protein PYW07_012739 [Mythimna separata]|uniref:Amine oxidase domain-containing protein n=1 Tax=Mythimna separata TaxID=271217 RepID=A0AAD7Y8Z2_MYTSE|nr:hypothetical protein PYW07_012739 [Mythimna separata]